MASVVVGGIVAALAFTGANYGGQYLDRLVRGDHSGELAAERKRHDLALEKYQRDVAAWNEKRQAYRDWLDKNYRDKMQADKNFENTDYAFKLYAQTHPDFRLSINPSFGDYYRAPPHLKNDRKNSELVFVGIAGLAGGAAIGVFNIMIVFTCRATKNNFTTYLNPPIRARKVRLVSWIIRRIHGRSQIYCNLVDSYSDGKRGHLLAKVPLPNTTMPAVTYIRLFGDLSFELVKIQITD